jgi:hypothetical protein
MVRQRRLTPLSLLTPKLKPHLLTFLVTELMFQRAEDDTVSQRVIPHVDLLTAAFRLLLAAGQQPEGVQALRRAVDGGPRLLQPAADIDDPGTRVCSAAAAWNSVRSGSPAPTRLPGACRWPHTRA